MAILTFEAKAILLKSFEFSDNILISIIIYNYKLFI